MTKPCPKCGEPLQEKKESRYCRNGCEIYTAAPQGASYDVHQRDVPASAGHSKLVAGGIRRVPVFDE
jgi:hypothetical protein